MGPAIVFDKSFLQALRVDETVWLDAFFLANIVPLFFVETLADLEKATPEGRSPESVVELLAAKTPANAVANVHHRTLILRELAGAPRLLMDTRPIVAGGIPKRTPDGRLAVEFNGFPEAEVLHRWQQGDFLEAERAVAREWRAALAAHDIDQEAAIAVNVLPSGLKVSNLDELKAVIDSVCLGADRHLLDLLMEFLDVPVGSRPKVFERWGASGSPSDLSSFAPFATHVFKVDLLYLIGVARGFISGERASNRVDMAYLYYLPFCMVFASGDRLHERTVPLFLSQDQRYIRATDLKAALAELDVYFESLPDHVKEQGVMRFAGFPPSTLDNEVTKSWDQLMRPDWREIGREREEQIADPEFWTRPLASAAEVQATQSSATPLTEEEAQAVGESDPDLMFVKRSVPVRRGRWRIVPRSLSGEGGEGTDS